MELPLLPTLNACLNAIATVLLVRGRRLVRAGEIDAHRRTMLSAFAVSAVFLASYLLHKYLQDYQNTPFPGDGWERVLYLSVLGTHIPLAMTVPVFAITLIVLGLRGGIERHRRIARIAWPIWMYVSVTGVIVYAMLYLWPHATPPPS